MEKPKQNRSNVHKTSVEVNEALSLVSGPKQFTKSRTKLFVFFLLSQFSVCFLFKTLNQNELQKSLER